MGNKYSKQNALKRLHADVKKGHASVSCLLEAPKPSHSPQNVKIVKDDGSKANHASSTKFFA